MIPATATKNVQTILPNDSVEFGIQASPEAFKVLVSNLYQNKPRAILRELGCNALDSHVMNGNPDEPFVVKLPNAMNEELVVQDFGTGLSHENMTVLYSTIFGSNKRKTNDQIGGLGLGSKTPFSYTDTFTVTSNHDGMSRTYMCYMNEDEIPCITIVDEREMKDDERTGLTIKIPVKNKDSSEFINAATTVFSHFKVKPKIGVAIHEPEYTYTIGSARIKAHTYSNRSHVIMGPVAYVLNSQELPNELHRRFNHLIGNIDFVANIGELTVAPSRETLSFDRKTVTALKRIFLQAEADIAAHLTKSLEDAETYSQAVKHARGLSNYLPAQKEVFWQGVRVYTSGSKSMKAEDVYGLAGLTVSTQSMYYTKTPKIRNPGLWFNTNPADVELIIIKDTENKPYVKRLEKIQDQVQSANGVLVFLVPLGHNDFFTKHCLPLIKTDFDGAEILRLSEIEIEKTASNGGARVASKAFFSKAVVNERQSDNSWRATTEYRLMPQFNAYEGKDFTLDDKLKTGDLWIGFNATNIIDVPKEFDGVFDDGVYKQSLAHFMALMVQNRPIFEGKDIIGVPKALETQKPTDMSKNAGYVALEELKALAKEEAFCKHAAWIGAQCQTFASESVHIKEILMLHLHKYPDSAFAKTAKKLYDASCASTSVQYSEAFVKVMLNAMNAIGIELEHTHFVFAEQRWTKFMKNHPLLEWATDMNWQERMSDRVEALIDLMESHYNAGTCK